MICLSGFFFLLFLAMGGGAEAGKIQGLSYFETVKGREKDI